MKKKICLTLLAALAILPLFSCEEKNPPIPKPEHYIYVAPNASKSGTGDKTNPMDFSTAIYKAQPDTVFLLAGGVYKYNTRLSLFNDGAPNHYIKVVRENPEEKVIFDFSDMVFQSDNRGIQVYGDFWHFDGIDICGAGDNGMYISGSYNIVENCNFYNNRDSGLQIGRSSSSDKTIDSWPHYNLVRNCTAWANYDDETYGENADGFAAKLTIGYGNVFDGCIAFRNSDDGWDLYAKEDSGNIGTVIIENCVAFENGYLPYQIDRQLPDGTPYKSHDTLNGDGIGYKLGGSVMEGDVVLRNSMTFNNKLHGVGDNSNPGVLSIKNVTTVNNCVGLNEDGTVKDRGIPGVDNKSNNVDLARDTKSYNNYYGIVSYVNNQANYDVGISGESSYNEDHYRGSCAYSIFQTEYNDGEVYRVFNDYSDASSYQTNMVDTSFNKGELFTGISDASFASLEPINALCESREKVAELIKYDELFRNEDRSVNMGDVMRIVDQNLLTFANGKPIGAQLNKSSYNEYEHTEIPDLTKCTTRDEVKVEAAKTFLEVLCDEEAVYQDFEIAKRINGCEITWESSNTDVISILDEEEISTSTSVFVTALVTSPKENTKVKLTATISCGDFKSTKEFDLNVRARKQAFGKIVNSGDSSIRVNKYEEYVVPRIYATDASSNTGSPLSSNLYDISYTYEFASDRNARYYPVDGVYTSVSGVYKVTATLTSKIEADNGKTESVVYYVYIVDKDCDIDFVNQEYEFTLHKDGYALTGEVSNILGIVHSVVSPTPLELTQEELMNHPDVQTFEIEKDSITANFLADNTASQEYYTYTIISNYNKNKVSEIYENIVKVQKIETHNDFYKLATSGKIGTYSSGDPVIYSLENDLDFAEYEWNITTGVGNFGSLFNGNGHTVSNVTIYSETGAKNVNMFYKIQNGTIMNVNFNNISIENKNTGNGKQVGIIGELQGGYVHNVRATNINAHGKEGVGGIIGSVTGGVNYISNCQFDNRNANEGYRISAVNKYAGGIVGNGQKNSDQTVFELHIENCVSLGTVGDGKDAGGNTGGIIGRVKNETSAYKTIINNCYFKGKIIAKGQYNAGILGDLDNGAGYCEINNCYSEPIIIYNDVVLDGRLADVKNEEVQMYAHKNSNPIIGRAVLSTGEYNTNNNYGTWSEYYSSSVHSLGFVFHSFYGPDWEPTTNFYKNVMTWNVYDVETNPEGIFIYDETTHFITLR